MRLGEGSRFHAAVFLGFLLGVGLYMGVLQAPLGATLGALPTGSAVTWIELLR